MDIKEIIDKGRNASEVIADLKTKIINVPAWSVLEKEYDPTKHPVKTDLTYNRAVEAGKLKEVSTITIAAQKLAVERITGLMFGIPVQRIYKPQNEKEKQVADIMEAIFQRNRIDSLNMERSRNLYASCENVTIWYAQAQPTIYAGYQSALKLRCKNYSPMQGAQLFPLFDEYDDMIALSVAYKKLEADKQVEYFDAYTADEHIRWRYDGANPVEELREEITLQKISGLYIHRGLPIWENLSENIYEAEWTLSRNGNYIRKNARPTFVIYSDDEIAVGGEKAGSSIGRNVLRLRQSDKAEYATWNGATDAIKYHVEEILRLFFTQLQLPDMSMDSMKATPMSGEARKMLFIDAQMKVLAESGIWLEMFDREVNVVRAYVKTMFPSLASAVDTLYVENVITPYQIKDETEKVNLLASATGGKAIMSQKTAVQYLGYADDVDEELNRIAEEAEQGAQDIFNMPVE